MMISGKASLADISHRWSIRPSSIAGSWKRDLITMGRLAELLVYDRRLITVPLTESIFDGGNAFAEKAPSAIAPRVRFFLLSFAKWTYVARLRRAFYRNTQRKCHSLQKFLAIILHPSQPMNNGNVKHHQPCIQRFFSRDTNLRRIAKTFY